MSTALAEPETTAVAEPEPETQTQVPPEQLALPGIDRREIDAIEVGFSGSVKLDRSDPADVALIRKLRLGEEVSLHVDGLVVARGGAAASDEDGNVDVTHKTKVKVHSLSRPVFDREPDSPDPDDEDEEARPPTT